MRDNTILAVFDSFGLLEHVLSFVPVPTLSAASAVNRRWNEAGRADFLWKSAANALWRDKVGVPHVSGEDDQLTLPLFWRSLYTKDAIERMSIQQIQTLFDHPLLKQKKCHLKRCLGEREMQLSVRLHMLDVMSDKQGPWDVVFFNDLWFGSYACSVMDARRALITKVELCSPSGFDMYFKIAEAEVLDQSDLDDLSPYEDHSDILLYRHSACYFEESHDFAMETNDSNGYHPTDLKWRWLEHGRQLQVGPYPPLTVTRRDNWAWKLENVHVVLVSRDSM